MARKKRTAAQKAATRRMIAANRAARKAPAKRRKNPMRVAYAGRAPTGGARGRVRFRNPIGSRRMKSVRRRRNPIQTRGIMGLVRQAAVAATGALALDAAWAYLPIPADWKIGALKHAAKGAGAIVLGMLAGKIVTKATAEKMTMGALTVILHDAARDVLATSVPGLKLDGMGYYSAGQVVNGLGEYVGASAMPSLAAPTMGEYMGAGISPDARAMMDGYSYY